MTGRRGLPATALLLPALLLPALLLRALLLRALLLIELVVLPQGAAQAAEDASVPVRQVVLDIVSFTRWPQPHAALRLCVVGQPMYADAFFAPDVQPGSGPPGGGPPGGGPPGGGPTGAVPLLTARMRAGDSQLGAACDVVYEGTLAPAERSEVLRSLAGHPVLTVGEAGPGCIETTMFCLNVSGRQVSFASNVDAISRSGVRLNPRVLLLGRRATPGVAR